jgi:hypothetical protein
MLEDFPRHGPKLAQDCLPVSAYPHAGHTPVPHETLRP